MNVEVFAFDKTIDVMLDADRIAEAALAELGQFFTEKVQEKISVPYPPASLPDFPPHLRSGDLSDSCHWVAYGPKMVKIVVGKFYSVYLELGTRKMLARPFFKNTILENLPHVERIVRDADLTSPPSPSHIS